MSIFSGIYGSGISSNSYNSAGTERTGSADSTYVKNPETSTNTSIKNAVPGSTIEGTVVSSKGDTATMDFGGGVKIDLNLNLHLEVRLHLVLYIQICLLSLQLLRHLLMPVFQYRRITYLLQIL